MSVRQLVDNGVALFIASIRSWTDDEQVNRTERLYSIGESLRRAGSRGVTAQRLAAEHEVSVRTIKRDLAALQVAGSPIWSRTGPGGGYGMAAGSTLPPVNFTGTQALSLMAVVSAAGSAPFVADARSATRKVMDVLDPGARAAAQALSSRIWVDTGPPVARRVLGPIERGLADQLVLRIGYTDSRGRSSRRDVEPMILAYRRGKWALVGWCRLRDAVRWFDLDRITAATTTRTPCTGHPVELIGEPPKHARAVSV